jgi:penicillin amidase
MVNVGLVKRILRVSWPLPEITAVVAASTLTIVLVASLRFIWTLKPPANWLVTGVFLLLGIAMAGYANLWMLVRAFFWLRVSYLKLDQGKSFTYISASIEFGDQGIPCVEARTRPEAMRALGYLMARDRFFQMDLLRREPAGQLAEVLGRVALAKDISRRQLDLSGAANRILDSLPPDQKAILRGFADGVNDCLQRQGPPFECRLLNYTPRLWDAADSVLVALNLHYQLSFDYETKRMVTIMEKTLPSEVVAFLTPTSAHLSALVNSSSLHLLKVPVEALRGISTNNATAPVQNPSPLRGSNVWAVSGQRTQADASLLANDLHLPLAVPNLLYAARLRYEQCDVFGVFVPGLPIVLSGTNRNVSWGIATLYGDCLDLIELERNAQNLREYKTPSGWKQFSCTSEVVEVRGQAPFIFERLSTIWGPVTEKALLGSTMAIQWTALDPGATNIRLIDMDRVTGVQDGLAVAREFAGPPLAVALADAQGHVAWTVSGRLPLRRGFDGTSARSWANGECAWEGYIPPEELPCSVDPAQGVVIAANHNVVETTYPHRVGHNFVNGARAKRISSVLITQQNLTDYAMTRLQMDVDAEFYEFYRTLAMSLVRGDSDMDELCRDLCTWDGQAKVESTGLATLVVFRELLIDKMLRVFLAPCLEADQQFRYTWRDPEPALRSLLLAQPSALLGQLGDVGSWHTFLSSTLRESVLAVREVSNRNRPASEMPRWGDINIQSIRHPLSAVMPVLRTLLDMPSEPVPGCAFSVCVAAPTYGAAVRIVTSPGRDKLYIQMPCGQSGHPLSVNYDAGHSHWSRGVHVTPSWPSLSD